MLIRRTLMTMRPKRTTMKPSTRTTKPMPKTWAKTRTRPESTSPARAWPKQSWRPLVACQSELTIHGMRARHHQGYPGRPRCAPTAWKFIFSGCTFKLTIFCITRAKICARMRARVHQGYCGSPRGVPTAWKFVFSGCTFKTAVFFSRMA